MIQPGQPEPPKNEPIGAIAAHRASLKTRYFRRTETANLHPNMIDGIAEYRKQKLKKKVQAIESLVN